MKPATRVFRHSLKALILVFLITLFSSGCSVDIGAAMSIILAAITGRLTAQNWIPPKARPKIADYIKPWPDPGFDEPVDNPVNHGGDASGSFSSPPGFWSPPGGSTPTDGSGNCVYEQIEPSAGANVDRKQDSFGQFAR